MGSFWVSLVSKHVHEGRPNLVDAKRRKLESNAVDNTRGRKYEIEVFLDDNSSTQFQ
jgi:hypothetical protein